MKINQSLTNVHIVMNRFIYDNRVLKEVCSIHDAFFFNKVIVFSLWDTGLKESEKIKGRIYLRRIPLKSKKLGKSPLIKIIMYFEFLFKILYLTKNINVVIIHCHNWAPLPIGLLMKFIKGAFLFYDCHELQEDPDLVKGLRWKLLVFTERLSMNFVDHVITVSDSIKKWYQKKYKLRDVTVIKNYPSRIERDEIQGDNILKKKFYIPLHNILFIYQGKFVSGRGIEALLNVFSRTSRDKHIVFMGFGELEKEIKTFADKNDNIHYQPAVSRNEIIKYSSSADIGINMADKTSINRYYGLPNKLFEYIAAGIPVIVSNFPERAQIVDTYSCGWKVEVIDKVEEEKVYDLITSLTIDEIEEKKANTLKLRNYFVWEKQEGKLINLYNSLLK